MGGVLILFLVGCGGGGGKQKPETVNISGTIYLNGTPLADADVNFISPDGFASYGKTGPDGKYTLVQGAVTGKNKVYISKIEGGNVELNPEEGMDAGQLEAMGSETGGGKNVKLPKQVVPADYSDPAKTKLTYDVPEAGTDSADFKL